VRSRKGYARCQKEWLTSGHLNLRWWQVLLLMASRAAVAEPDEPPPRERFLWVLFRALLVGGYPSGVAPREPQPESGPRIRAASSWRRMRPEGAPGAASCEEGLGEEDDVAGEAARHGHRLVGQEGGGGEEVLAQAGMRLVAQEFQLRGDPRGGHHSKKSLKNASR